MFRTRSLLLAVGAAAALAGCGSGGGDASQGKVEDRVRDFLVEDGLAGENLSTAEADDIAVCIASTMFGSDDFTRDERNEIASANDDERPSDELVAKVEDLVDECTSGEASAGPDAPADDAEE
jgi:hypothetical protein